LYNYFILYQSILILFFVCLITSVNAQNLDSSCRIKMQKSNSLAKQNVFIEKEKHQQSYDSIQKLKKKQYVNQSETEIQKLLSKTDSNARKHHQYQGKTLLKKEVQPINNQINNSKSLQQQQKTKLNQQLKRKKIIALSAEIRSDNYFTTAQNPLMRNEPYYSRLYIAPTVSLFGLPFKGNFFFTTENNNTYKSDFFSFRFDANAYKQMAAKELQNQINEAKKTDRLRSIDIQRTNVETSKYEQELNRLKSQIPNLDSFQNQVTQKAEHRSKAYIEEQEKLAKEKLKNASESEKQKIENDLKHKKDSITLHYQQEAGDSLAKAQQKGKQTIDTTKLRKYLKLKAQFDQLQLKKQKLEQLRQEDSSKVMQKISASRNPDDLRKMAKEQMKGKGGQFLQQMLSIERFGIGVVNPQYSENTLFASSVKGLDIGVNRENYFYDLTIGRTTPQFLGMFSDKAPEYTRNIVVSRIGLGEIRKDHLAFEVLHAYDPINPNEKENISPIRNTVYNISGQYTFLKNTIIQSHVAHSSYKELNTRTTNNNYKASNNLNLSALRSYLLKVNHNIGENTKAEVVFKQTGIGFRTIGNPFLRKNFREIETKLEQQFYKKRIKLSVMYKEMRDNLVEIGAATNRIKGYGLKISTSFDKYPNITLSYNPYQQGNNHPDSLYKTNNQFSVTTAIITFKKRYRSVNWMGMASYTRSAMEINEMGLIAYKMYNSIQTFQMGNRNTLIFSLMQNTTAPFVDSLNSSSIQVSHTYLISSKFSFTGIGEYSKFKNDAFKAGGGVQLNMTIIKNLSLSLLSKYDRIHGIWNLSNANVFTGRASVTWRW
jgi:hypothetical protein